MKILERSLSILLEYLNGLLSETMYQLLSVVLKCITAKLQKYFSEWSNNASETEKTHLNSIKPMQKLGIYSNIHEAPTTEANKLCNGYL